MKFRFKIESDLKEKINVLLTALKIAKINVNVIRCNDASEIIVLYEEYRTKGVEITFASYGLIAK